MDVYKYEKALHGVLELRGRELAALDLDDARDAYGAEALEESTAQRRQERIVPQGERFDPNVEAYRDASALARASPRRSMDQPRPPAQTAAAAVARNSLASASARLSPALGGQHVTAVYSSSIKNVSLEEEMRGEVEEAISRDSASGKLARGFKLKEPPTSLQRKSSGSTSGTGAASPTGERPRSRLSIDVGAASPGGGSPVGSPANRRSSVDDGSKGGFKVQKTPHSGSGMMRVNLAKYAEGQLHHAELTKQLDLTPKGLAHTDASCLFSRQGPLSSGSIQSDGSAAPVTHMQALSSPGAAARAAAAMLSSPSQRGSGTGESRSRRASMSIERDKQGSGTGESRSRRASVCIAGDKDEGLYSQGSILHRLERWGSNHPAGSK